MRSIACNPQLVAECNPPQVVYNQSEGRNIQSLRFDNIQFARRTDYIRLSAITYQSFGLDKNKALRDEVLYFLSFVSEKEPAKTEDYSNSLPQCGQYFENHSSFQKKVSQCGQRHQKYSKMQNMRDEGTILSAPSP